MRNAFANELTLLAARDERIVLLSGDIGNRLFNDFKASFPRRFLNCGIAEQNLLSVSAGMALSGLRPVVYTIAPFVTARCLEQFRIDLGYHRAPVVVVGVGAGLSYANLGATHESCDDIAMLRPIPGVTIACPGDAHEVRAALGAALNHDGPVYLRIGKKGEAVVHTATPPLILGRGLIIRDGDEVCLLSTGNVLPLAIDAAEVLARHGVSTRVVSMHTVKPIDEELLAESFDRFDLVVTLEEHSVIGGLGGAVAEWCADSPSERRARLMRVGSADCYRHEAGDQEHTRTQFGLTTAAVTARILKARGAAPLTLARPGRAAV